MYFKYLSIATLILMLSSCSWIRTEPKAVKGFQSKSMDLSCIKTVPSGLQDLFAGNLTSSADDQSRILGVFDCMDHALEVFSTFTKGDHPDFYSSRELQSFANRFLPESTPITEPFINSIFRLKRTIVGGSDSQINRNEIKSLRDKLFRFGKTISPFSPHIRVLVKPGNASSNVLREASLAMNHFVMSLSGILADSPNVLEWRDLDCFIRELELFTSKGDVTSLTLVREQIPIFQYAKLLLVGGSETAIETVKWQPIFSAISNFYSALLLTSTTPELLEQLNIEVQSNEEEQARAVTKLTAILRVLIHDEHIHNRASMIILADRFSKALFLNSIIFPRNLGSLALKPFLESPALRKLAGQIIEQISHLDPDHLDLDTLQTLIDHGIELLEQASIANNPNPREASYLNLPKVLDYLKELSPLMDQGLKLDSLKEAVNALSAFTPILIGKEVTALSPDDLRQLITKSFDFYSIWSKGSQTPLKEKIGAILDTLARAPCMNLLSVSQIRKAMQVAESLLNKFSPSTQVPWDEIRSYLTKGLKLKSVLFQTPDSTLSGYELNQFAFLYEPFRGGDDIGTTLVALSSLLQVRSFENANLLDLISAIDRLLPSTMQISSFGIPPKLIGELKAVFVGGNPLYLSRYEYADLARLAGVLYQRLHEILPSDLGSFSPGLDSETANLAGVALKAVIDTRRGYIYMSDLKALIMDLLARIHLRPGDAAVDRFLIGFQTRVLIRSKGPKPKALSGLAFKASDLNRLLALIEKLKAALKPIEATFSTIHPENGLLSRSTLLDQVTDPNTQNLIRSIQPLLFGKNHFLHLNSKTETNQFFTQFDITYKTAILNLLQFLFPYYKINSDPMGANIARLNQSDLTDLLSDVNDLVTDLGLSYGYSPAERSAASRMKSINLFTKAGNGDEYIDAIETTEFLTITVGGKHILKEVEAAIYPKCYPTVVNTDSISTIPISCLDDQFFKLEFLKDRYTIAAPDLISQMTTWGDEGIQEFKKSMLNSIDPNWVKTKQLNRVDLEAFISVPYYTENLFQRLDLNQNDILEFSETMKGFPTFCREIKSAAGSVRGSCLPGEDPNQIEAIYGYLLFRGYPPRGMQRGDSLWQRIKAVKEILSWFKYWRKLDKRPEARDPYPPQIDRKGILKIMSNLATPTP